MSRIDVIVPCYNYGRFLRDCVGSALSQEGCDVRVLIIDDCSHDDSLELAQAIAAADPRVTVRGHAVNRGHIATYNEGIDWVSAPYMLLLSADDAVAPGAFARAIAMMEADPGISFVHGTSLTFTSHQGLPPVPEDHPSGVRLMKGYDYIEAQCDRPHNPVETPTAIVRTRCQKIVGHYDAALPHAGDMEMWLRLAAEGDVGFIEDVQAFTRLHGRNMREAYNQSLRRDDFRQRLEVFSRFFAEHAGDIPDAQRLEATARQRLTEEALRDAHHALYEDSSIDLEPLLAFVRELVPPVRFRLLVCRLHMLVLLRRMAGPHLWHAAKRTRNMLRSMAAR